MSVEWAQRQRRTNKLARAIAGYLFEHINITPKQIYGLSKLSWITNSYEGENASYIKSTKILAFEDIFSRNFHNLPDNDVYKQIGTILRSKSISTLASGPKASPLHQHVGNRLLSKQHQPWARRPLPTYGGDATSPTFSGTGLSP